VKSQNWHLILLLSLPGPVMGFLTLTGVIPFGVDRWFWLGISIVAAVTIAMRVDQGAFRTGALVGFFLGATSKLIQAVWSDTYVANNPELLGSLTGATEGAPFQYRMLMLVPFVGLTNALLVGLMSYFAFKAVPAVRRPRDDETPSIGGDE
jgi:hypothetical protein